MLKSSRLREKKRKRRLFLTAVWSIVIIAVLFCLVQLSQLKALALTKVSIMGNIATSYEDISKIAMDDMSGTYWYFFPRNNAFIYPKEKVRTDLLNSLKRLSDVMLATEGNTLHIEVVERKPDALWCKDSSSVIGDCYFMDSTGYIFAKAPNFDGEVYIKYYGMVADENPIGHTYIDATSAFIDLEAFAHSLKNVDLVASSIRSTAPHEYSIEVAEGGKLLISDQNSYQSTLANISTTLSSLPLGSKSLHMLEYLDVRLANKVFYKLVGSTASTSPARTSR